MQYYPFTLFVLLSLLFHRSAAVLRNVTIDDQFGDSLTGAKVSYLPVNFRGDTVWKSSSACADCAIRPDTTQSFNKTWTSATYFGALTNMTAGFNFKGTALYIYFILANYPADTGLVSSTTCDFRLDGRIIGGFRHQSNGSFQFEYNKLAFSSTSLFAGDHTLFIEISGVNTSSYVIFDYAMYTTDVAGPLTSSTPHNLATSTGLNSAIPTSKSSPSASPSGKANVGAVIGGTVGSITLFVLCSAALVLCCRRRTMRRAHTTDLLDLGERATTLTPYRITRDEPTTVSPEMSRQLEAMTARLQALETQSQQPPISTVSGIVSPMYTTSSTQLDVTSSSTTLPTTTMSKRDQMFADQVTNRSVTTESPPRYSA